MARITGLLSFKRRLNLFAAEPRLVADLEDRHDIVKLAPQQLLHPEVPAELVVRRGKLRLSQFLHDGQEVTREVLQAGATLVTISGEESQSDPAADLYPLSAMVLMALGEAELWALPAGSLEKFFRTPS